MRLDFRLNFDLFGFRLINQGLGCYPTCDVVPPSGVCDKVLEKASHDYPGESSEEMFIQQSRQERLDQN